MQSHFEQTTDVSVEAGLSRRDREGARRKDASISGPLLVARSVCKVNGYEDLTTDLAEHLVGVSCGSNMKLIRRKPRTGTEPGTISSVASPRGLGRLLGVRFNEQYSAP